MSLPRPQFATASPPPVAGLCPICKSGSRLKSFDSSRGPVYRCLGCGLYFVIDNGVTPPSQESLFYSTIDERRYCEYFAPFRSGQYRQILGQLHTTHGASLLDVGASYGWMVQVGLDLGLDSRGLEPGDAPVPTHLADRIVREPLESYAKSANRKFDVITIWHVLEHLPDPVRALSQMYDLLEDGGTLIIAVPTSDGWLFRLALAFKALTGRTWLLEQLFYFHNPNMHFTYPNATSIHTLLRHFNMRVWATKTIEAFDWCTIWKRSASPVGRQCLRLLGPVVAFSRFTRRENLIVIAQKPGDTET